MRVKVVAAYLNNVERRRRRLGEVAPTGEESIGWDDDVNLPVLISWDDDAGVDTPLHWST